MQNEKKFLQPSTTPLADIELLSYEGQESNKKRYKEGHEHFMAELPVMTGEEEIPVYKNVMQRLAATLTNSGWVRNEQTPKGIFERTILAIEKNPDWGNKLSENFLKEGSELVMGKWGMGYSSPVHGHATGYLHEEVLFGKVMVNTFRMISPASDVVRPVQTEIVTKGTFVSMFTPENKDNFFKRQTLIHSFTALEFSATLHYLPEHTRDGRDNGFKVQYFDDVYKLKVEDVKRIGSLDGMYLQKGDVVLVRSSNVPDYGDHYIVITGHPVQKDHGIRPQDVAIHAPFASLLNEFDQIAGLTLLKLNPKMAELFLDFHGVIIENNEVIFPRA